MDDLTEYCSRVSFLPKDNNVDLRLITDFRGINGMLLRPVYPFESTKLILENIPAENIWFATLDMIQGYFQVPLDEETSNLTLFITPWGKYKYLRAPMGLAPSSDWFNSFTSTLVQGIEGMSKLMYDFLGTANSLDKLEEILDKFLGKCEELGVKISTKNFKMGSKVKFRGLLVTNKDGRVHIEADPCNQIDLWNSFINGIFG